MKLKMVCSAVVVSMLAVGAGFAGSVRVQAAAMQKAPVTTTLKGVIKTIDDKSVVIVPASNKKSEVEFDLTSSAKRTGALAAGTSVEVSYYYDSGKRVVTSVSGKETPKVSK